MGYTRLTKEERYQIRAILDADCTIREIASVLGRCAGTISRELSCNRGLRGYRPGQADRLASERASAKRYRRRITTHQWTEISQLIRLDWSPEQISARGALEGTLDISPEWIYQWLFRFLCGQPDFGSLRAGPDFQPASCTIESFAGGFLWSRHLGDAIDRVRGPEHKALLTAEGESMLTRSRYLWLRHPDRITNKSWRRLKALTSNSTMMPWVSGFANTRPQSGCF